MPQQVEAAKDYPYFYLDDENFFVEATNFIMTGQDLDLIYLFLSSELGFFVFSKFYSGPQFDETGFRYKKAYIENTYIPKPDIIETKVLKNFINAIKKHEQNDMEINNFWAEVVDLNPQERKYVSSYKNSLLDNFLDKSNFIR